jgi:hypothetical protein
MYNSLLEDKVELKVGDVVTFRTHDFRKNVWHWREGEIEHVYELKGKTVVLIRGFHSGTLYSRLADALDNPHKQSVEEGTLTHRKNAVNNVPWSKESGLSRKSRRTS